MDVLWSKDRLHKIFSTDSLMVHANATGDCGAPSILACYLCGGDGSLRRLGGTYTCNGIEEKYDRMLQESFGVEVSRLDCMICDHCIHQLRNAHRFRNLVKAAFVKSTSERPLSNSTRTKPDRSLSKPDFGGSYMKKAEAPKHLKQKATIDNLQRRCELRRERKRLSNMHVETKKANVACTVCNQRYPMIVPFDGIKKFVCSRCKKNAETYGACKKCNLRLPLGSMQEHLKTHARAKPKCKSRLPTGPRALPSQSKTENLSRTQTYVKYPKRYHCSKCDKRYLVPQHLAHHISTAHGDALDCTCTVCGKDMKTRDKLDHHMHSHTGQHIYQCHVCMKVFKSQRNLQAHYMTHAK
ncbi:unnamed protein product, partial [Iphiclides podalirius]